MSVEASEPVAWPRPRYAWYVVGVLLVTYAFAIVDRISIGLLVDPIKADLGISDTQVGLIQGLAFAIFYSAFGLPMGILVDRWKRVRLLSLSLAVWSSATIACGLATSFGGLFASRVFVGAGEASVTPASSSIIADLFRPEQRAKAFGVFMVGGSLGTAGAYLVGAFAIQATGSIRAFSPILSALRDWQIVFLLIGMPGVLLALLVYLTVREPLRREKTQAVTKLSLGPVWRLIKASPLAYGSIMGATVLNVLVVNAQVGWAPTLFIRVHHWTAAQTGTTLGLVGLPCGTFSALSAGWFMAWLYRRGRIDAPMFAVLGQSIAWATAGVMIALAPTPQLALVAYGVANLFSIWASTGVITGLSQITPNEMRGQVIAIYMVINGLLSLTVGAVSVGLLTDHVFTAPTGVSPAMAVVYFGCGAGAIILLLIGRKSFEAAAVRAKAWATD